METDQAAAAATTVSNGGSSSTSASPSFPQRLTRYVLFTCLLAASGGLMYGYDLVVAGGVSIMGDFLHKFYPRVYEAEAGRRHVYDNYCRYDDAALQLYTSCLYVAALMATLVAGMLTRAHGHRASMLTAGLFFLLGTLLGAAAQNLAMLMLGRISLGIGIGFSNQAIPLYLSEMAPARYRGGLHLMFIINVSLGVVGGNLVNYVAQRVRPWGWRLSLAAAGLPAAAVLMAGLILPDTPSFLISRGQHERAKQVLAAIRGCHDIEQEYLQILHHAAAAAPAASINSDHNSESKESPSSTTMMMNRSSSRHSGPSGRLGSWNGGGGGGGGGAGFKLLFCRRRNAAPAVMAIALPFFQQFSGSDAILFYGPFLFRAAGLGSRASLYSTLIIGLMSFVGTMASIFVVDSVGRRKILLISTSIMFICMVGIGVVFRLDIRSEPMSKPQRLSKLGSVLELGGVCVFIATFTASWGPLAWLIPSEICSQDIRSAAQSVAVFTNMLFKFLVAQTFLSMLCAFKFAIFFFFAAWLAVMGVFTLLLLPETKGIPIDQMVHVWKAHWFWGRFVDDTHDHAQP